jgi:hypothetical protein
MSENVILRSETTKNLKEVGENPHPTLRSFASLRMTLRNFKTAS